MFVAILQRPRVPGRGRPTVAGMSRLALVSLLAVAVAVVDAAPAAARQRWRPPLPDGTLSAAFTFDRAAPYRRGARRGIDLRGAPYGRVVAACAGVVTHAGRVPGWGRGVSLRCGGLVATELGLASVSVVRGARLWPGATVGRLGSGGRLRLGARQVGVRHGYVDPLGLLSRGERSAPPGVIPRGGPPVAPRPHATPPAVTPSRAAALPWLAWAGLALLATGVGGRGGVRARPCHHRRTEMALAQR